MAAAAGELLERLRDSGLAGDDLTEAQLVGGQPQVVAAPPPQVLRSYRWICLFYLRFFLLGIRVLLSVPPPPRYPAPAAQTTSTYVYSFSPAARRSQDSLRKLAETLSAQLSSLPQRLTLADDVKARTPVTQPPLSSQRSKMRHHQNQ